MYSVAAFIIASSLLTKGLYAYTKNQTWMPILIGACASFLIISIYERLAINNPGANLFEINEAVFGVVIGKIFSILYVFYFLMLVFLNTQDLGTFVKGFILPATPMTLIYIMFLLICAYASKKGAVTMTRYAAVITYTYIAIIVINGFLLLNKTHPENLLPIFTVPVKNYLLGAHLATMLPFCEVLVFMMFTRYMQSPVEIGKAMKSGLFIGAAILVFIIIRDITVQGEYINNITMPTFASIRLIDVGDILTRVEIIYAVTIMSMLFFKVSIIFFASVSGVSMLFKIEQYRIFIFVIGALVTVYSNAIFVSSFQHLKWFETAATYSTFFLFVLPTITLIVSEIKKRSNKEEPDAAIPQSID